MDGWLNGIDGEWMDDFKSIVCSTYIEDNTKYQFQFQYGTPLVIKVTYKNKMK